MLQRKGQDIKTKKKYIQRWIIHTQWSNLSMRSEVWCDHLWTLLLPMLPWLQKGHFVFKKWKRFRGVTSRRHQLFVYLDIASETVNNSKHLTPAYSMSWFKPVGRTNEHHHHPSVHTSLDLVNFSWIFILGWLLFHFGGNVELDGNKQVRHHITSWSLSVHIW